MSALVQGSGTATRDAPIRAMVQQNRDRGVEPWARRDLPWGTLGVLGAVAWGAAVVAWWVHRRRRRACPPAERAFLLMSRRLGLDRSARGLIKEIAAECGLEPLTLLVSPSALHDALTRIDRQRWRERAGWRKLLSLAEAA